MLKFPAFLTRAPGGRNRHHDDLWSVAERLNHLGVGDITGYNDELRILHFSGWSPMRLERPGGRALTREQIQELEDDLAVLRY